MLEMPRPASGIEKAKEVAMNVLVFEEASRECGGALREYSEKDLPPLFDTVLNSIHTDSVA